jgi:DMSO/TMAO reductase YedYZ molybdopterin-dependent catalytic subunit
MADLQLRVEGEVISPRAFSFADLAALPGQLADVGALIPGREGGAVRLASILDAVGRTAAAQWATLESSDGKFSISVPLHLLGAAVVAYRFGDGALPEKKGGPARFYVPDVEKCGTPGVDACANVKGLGTIRLTAEKDPAANHAH